jgi:hypothetical protein
MSRWNRARCMCFKVECMYKVVPAARRAATVATTASGSSLPVVLAARTVAATPSPVHSSKARRYTHGVLRAWTPTQCPSRASPLADPPICSPHAPNVARLPY